MLYNNRKTNVIVSYIDVMQAICDCIYQPQHF